MDIIWRGAISERILLSFLQGSPIGEAARGAFDNVVFDGTALRVRAVRTGQRGSYACKARNALGEAASNRVKLDVRCECRTKLLRPCSGIVYYRRGGHGHLVR